MRKFFGSSASSNVTNKENQQKPKEKDAEKSVRDKESQMEKRPGSAISQDFMPKKQQKAIKEWKKHEEVNFFLSARFISLKIIAEQSTKTSYNEPIWLCTL